MANEIKIAGKMRSATTEGILADAAEIQQETGLTVEQAIKELDDKAAAADSDISNLNANTGISDYEEFSDQKEYKAGDTVLKDGLLKTFITDHAAGAWNESEVEDGSLKGEIEFLNKIAIGDITNEINKGYYIATNDSVVNISNKISNSSYGFIEFDCKEGDKFLITGTGGGASRLWCFIDNSYNVLSVSYSSYTADKEFIVAPNQSSKLICNFNIRNIYQLISYQFDKSLLGYIEKLNSYSKFQNVIFSPISRITYTTKSDKSVDLTLSNNVNVFSGVDVEKITIPDGTYNVPLYNSLVYDLEDKTSKVVDITTSISSNFIILFHNDNNRYGGLLFCDFLYTILNTLNNALTSYYRYQSSIVSPPNRISIVKEDTTINLTIGAGGIKIFSSIDSSVIKIAENSYSIPNYNTLVYDLNDSSVKVINVAENSGGNYIFLLHNENGLCAGGCFVDYIISKDIKTLKTNKWEGKSILILGDSLTDQALYVNNLQNILGAKIYNRGISGTTVSIGSVENSFCERVDKETYDGDSHGGGMPTSVDGVIIFGGINDWGRLRSQNIGEISAQIDKSTFYGAYSYVISTLKNKYPKAEFYVINLHHVHSTEYSKWNEVNYIDEDDYSKGFEIAKNDTDKTLYDYRNAIENVSDFYGCHIIDLFNCGFSYNNKLDNTNYSQDGLHFNEEGAEIVAEYIAKKMN